jgi:hypothetical protein
VGIVYYGLWYQVGVVSGYCLLWVVIFVFIVTFSNFSVMSWLPDLMEGVCLFGGV